MQYVVNYLVDYTFFNAMAFLLIMCFKLLIFLMSANVCWTHFDDEANTPCSGKQYKNVTLAAYYVTVENQDNRPSYLDIKGKKLRSLQEYLDDRSDFITLAMDEKLGLPYATKVCIPELNKHFGHRLRFEIRDTGTDLVGMGYLRADIFVRTEIDSYDITVNKKATLVFEM